MEIFWPVIKPILHEVFQQHTQSEPQIHEVRTSPNRSRENLEIIPLENPPSGLWLKWNGFKWWMTPAGQQKSGAYFDQRQNHISARAYAEKMGYASAWDLCCFEGGFGLHLAAANLHVTAVDQSQAALDAFQKNLEANDLATAKVQMQKADIFEWLRERHQQGDTTDMIILDPPSFVKSKKDLKNAMRGYKELNLRAMQCLNPGGMLVTCTCSQGITDEILREIVNGAAHDCRRTVTVLAKSGASPDHAAPVGFPEGEYLRAWSLLVH
jgi:23S rRNA (cytosine1962-C5)-methyltransferase